MSTELISEEEIIMKLNLTSTLKELTENTITTEKVIAKKEKNKITYQTNNFNYILKIISPNKLVLNRKNNTLECTMYFELNKKKNAIYTFKEEEYTLEIEIKTTLINITDNCILIHYTVDDSNDSYEYNIEMSEIK